MMLPDPAFDGALDGALVFTAVFALTASLVAARDVPSPHQHRDPRLDGVPDLVGGALFSALAGIVVSGRIAPMLPLAALVLLAVPALRLAVPRLSMAGGMRLVGDFLAPFVAFAWAWSLVGQHTDAAWLRVLLMMAASGGALALLIGAVERIAREAVLTHQQWSRPVAAPRVLATPGPDGVLSGKRPRVSIHLCCYAEPPAVVMATMDRLAALAYDDYEVLVCDNNTPDEALWRPLELHCQRLNRRLGAPRFRFFHVAPLEGAKAGALNFCLEKMDPAATLVAVIDADYLAQADFLARLVPFFEDEAVGYLQTPHDYRGFARSPYLSACYWEYMPTNKVDYCGVSEYGGAFTIGTMCLLRTEALRRAGGWAEWCLTEDSEVSVRIRAAGYEGIYLGETFGRGLIPETFDDYKKQRFRWTAGPVQQLRRHWRLFLPAPFAPAMPGWTKLLEVLRCAAPLQALVALATAILGALSLVGALVSDAMDPVQMPVALWLAMALGTANGVVRAWHRYRLAGCHDPVQMVHAEIARLSLSYVILLAGLAGLSAKPLAWRRTPKFALTGPEGSVLASARTETMLGIGCFVAMLSVPLVAADLGRDAGLMVLILLAGLAASFLSATWMASLALDHARAVTGEEPEDEPEPVRLAA